MCIEFNRRGLQIVAGVTLLVAAWLNKPFQIVFGG